MGSYLVDPEELDRWIAFFDPPVAEELALFDPPTVATFPTEPSSESGQLWSAP